MGHSRSSLLLGPECSLKGYHSGGGYFQSWSFLPDRFRKAPHYSWLSLPKDYSPSHIVYLVPVAVWRGPCSYISCTCKTSGKRSSPWHYLFLTPRVSFPKSSDIPGLHQSG